MYGGNDLFGGGVDNFERSAVNTLNELVVDEPEASIILVLTLWDEGAAVNSKWGYSQSSWLGVFASQWRGEFD